MKWFLGKRSSQIFLEDVMKLKAKFKAKDWVLVKYSKGGTWWLTRFSHYNKDSTYPYACINGNGYKSCIPIKATSTY